MHAVAVAQRAGKHAPERQEDLVGRVPARGVLAGAPRQARCGHRDHLGNVGDRRRAARCVAGQHGGARRVHTLVRGTLKGHGGA